MSPATDIIYLSWIHAKQNEVAAEKSLETLKQYGEFGKAQQMSSATVAVMVVGAALPAMPNHDLMVMAQFAERIDRMLSGLEDAPGPSPIRRPEQGANPNW